MNVSSKKWSDIERFACSCYGIQPLDLLGPSRNHCLVRVRFIVWKALKELKGETLVAIGERYDRDHTSIMYGIFEANKDDLKDEYNLLLTHFKDIKTVDKPVDKLFTSCAV